MKTRKAVFIEGQIIENRLIGEASHPYCIHRVMFNNGKYAIVRAASGFCFTPGESLQRYNAEWFFHNAPVHLLSFEYIQEPESLRQLTEY